MDSDSANPQLQGIDNSQPRGLWDELHSRKVKVVAHGSEQGWARPANHKYHIMSFPPEILNMIIGHCVALPRDSHNDKRMLRPILTKIKVPAYVLTRTKKQSGHRHIPEIDNKSHHPKTPSWNWIKPMMIFEALGSFRNSPIDATLLRLSLFHDEGTKLLYGSSLCFVTHCAHPNDSPVTRKQKKGLNCVYQLMQNRSIGREDYTSITWRETFLNLLKLHEPPMEGQPLRPRLAWWIKDDPFLFFLYRIGPQKAGLIRKLSFEGQIRRYRLEDTILFTDKLRLYVPFLVKFCPRLEHLAFFIDRCISKRMDLPTIGDVLCPFLTEDFRQLTMLRTFEVHGPEGVDMSFAKETVEWVQSNALKR